MRVVVLAHRVLPDVEAQEVEADLAVVGDEGLLRVEFQPHLCQPFYNHPLQVREHIAVGVENDEPTGVADEAGGRFDRGGLAQGGLKAVEGDVGEEGDSGPPWGVPAWGKM